MKVTVFNYNNIFDELVTHLLEEGDFEKDWRKADVVVVWQDVMGDLKNIVDEAKKMGKKTIVAEHGYLSINDYIPPLNRPMSADKIAVWGQETKDWITKAGISEDKITITGCPFNSLKIMKVGHQGNRILFSPRHWDRDLEENFEIVNELKKGKHPVFTKILNGEQNPDRYPNPLPTQRGSAVHIFNCFSAISWADVVVGLGESTFGALSHLMGVPYISVDNWRAKDLLGKHYDPEEFYSQISPASMRVELKDLNKKVNEALKNPDINKDERDHFAKHNLGNEVDYLKEMLKLIYE